MRVLTAMQRPPETNVSAAPTLSVIVPCYNSSLDLERCLAALKGSSHCDFDLLVVDDGSTEPIASIVSRYGFNYLRIAGPGGPARARNRGVLQVNGKYVVFIDADVVVHDDTLQRFAEAFAADDTIDAVIGTYDDAPGDPSFLSQYKNLFHHYVHLTAHGDVHTFWSGCGAMRRDLFIAFGGFDEVRYRRPAIEDIELGTWLVRAGHRIVLDNRVKCQHLKKWTLKNLLRTDIFDRGVPWTKLMLRAKDMPSTLNVTGAQRLSVALVYLTLLAALIAPLVSNAGWIALGLFALVTLVNWDFYRYFARQRGIGFAVRSVPWHWLYFWYCGLGFLIGHWQHWREGRPVAQPVMVGRLPQDDSA